MAQETEAKLRFWVSPTLSKDAVSHQIEQVYLDFNNNKTVRSEIKNAFPEVDLSEIKEARVRRVVSEESTEYFLTLKGDGTLQRLELQQEISPEIFNSLATDKNLDRITKVRREIPMADGLTAEADEYSGNLEGLQIVEVEFDPEKFTLEEIVQRVQALIPGAEDVTHLKQYKNAAMAKRESLAELEEAVKAEIE